MPLPKFITNPAKLLIPASLALLILGAAALLPANLWASPLGQTEEDINRLKALSGKEFEIEFMSMMIGHHQSALDMAKLAPANANRQEVKDIAQKIVADQTREINQMTDWLKQWHNTTPKTGMMGEMSGMGMSDTMKLGALKGDDFDKEFITMMRMHHMSAVEMANLVPDRATQAELKTLGQNIVTTQTAEIKQFEGWLKAWYNIDAITGGTPPDTMAGGASGGGMSGENMSGGNTATGLPAAGVPSNAYWPAGLLIVALTIVSGATLAAGARLRKRT